MLSDCKGRSTFVSDTIKFVICVKTFSTTAFLSPSFALHSNNNDNINNNEKFGGRCETLQGGGEGGTLYIKWKHARQRATDVAWLRQRPPLDCGGSLLKKVFSSHLETEALWWAHGLLPSHCSTATEKRSHLQQRGDATSIRAQIFIKNKQTNKTPPVTLS